MKTILLYFLPLVVSAVGNFECPKELDGARWFRDPDDCRIGHICNDVGKDTVITICKVMYPCTMFNPDFGPFMQDFCIPMNMSICNSYYKEKFC